MIEDTQIEILAGRSRSTHAYDDDDISLIDVFTVIWRRKWFVVWFTLAATIMATAVALLLPPRYTSEAVIMPPAPPDMALASLTAAASGGLAGGVASQLGLKNQGDLYIGILQSRSIADHLIEKFHLQTVYNKDTLLDTRNALAEHVSMKAGKDTLIHIAVEDRDPKRATDLANAFVDELYQQNSRLALTESSQRRLFFSNQLDVERTALANAELALKNTQQSSGLVMPSGQAEALIRSATQLRAELASREVELEALRSFATDQNSAVQRLQREMDTLREQIRNLDATGGGGMQLSGKQLPEAGLDYARKARTVKYHEALVEFLSKQYEAAFIDEAKSAPVVQVIDRAVEPDKRSWPPRMILITGTAAGSSILAAIIVLTQNYLRQRQARV